MAQHGVSSGEDHPHTAGQAAGEDVLGPRVPPMDLTQLLEEPYTYNVYSKRQRLAGILFRALEDDTEDDKSIPFSEFVAPHGAIGPAALEPFSKLALELKLAVAAYCADSPSTLWALMSTCSIVRKGAEKHFWAFPNVWFLHDGALDCLCRAVKVCDPHVRKFVQQLVLPIDSPPTVPEGEAKVWWGRLKRGFPAAKKVWLLGRKPQVAPLLSAWKKGEPGTEAVEVVTSSYFARPMIWNRDGTFTHGDPKNWKVVHLPEPDPALRLFRGSVDWIQHILDHRMMAEERGAKQEEHLKTLTSPELVIRDIVDIRDNRSSIREMDIDIMALRRLRNGWGEPGSAEWQEWERRFWAVLSSDALRCADRVEDCRAARRLKLEIADGAQQVHFGQVVASWFDAQSSFSG
jgi:hypothetical protein